MRFNWEQVIGTGGVDLTDSYDEQSSDALYQDHPRSVPPGMPTDPGDDKGSPPLRWDLNTQVTPPRYPTSAAPLTRTSPRLRAYKS